MNESNGFGLGLLLVLGALGVGIVAVGIVLSRRTTASRYQLAELPQAQIVDDLPVQAPQDNETSQSPIAVAFPVQAPSVILENEQTVKFIRGPDRLLDEIVIHRKVLQYGG